MKMPRFNKTIFKKILIKLICLVPRLGLPSSSDEENKRVRLAEEAIINLKGRPEE